jgi:polyisoprenoid-binding protein YceI
MKAFLLISLLGVSAQAAIFDQVQLPQSNISFVSKQMNVPFEGKFSKFNAQLQFDPERLETAQAQLDIDLNSIDAGSSEANEEVKSKGWFYVKNFPTAKFVSTSVKKLENNRYEVLGNMTIKGKTNPMTILFDFKPQNQNATFEGNFALKRSQFDIGEGIWSDTSVVADEVQVRFKFLVLSTH